MSISSSTARPHRRRHLSRLAAGVGAVALAAGVTVATTSAASASASGNAAPHLLKPHAAHTSPAATGGNLVNHGGPVQTAPKVYVVYWGWTSDPSGEQTYLNNFLSSVGGTQWLSTVNQYGGGSQSGLLAGTWSDSASVPSHPSDSAIQSEAAKAAGHFGSGTSDNVEIVVATPTGHSTSGFGTQWCAYHGAVSSDRNVTYTDLPYMTDAGSSCGANSVRSQLDGVSIVEGHEMAETITDPLLNAWYDSSGAEIGDKCAWQNLSTISTSKGTFAVQPLWSNSAGGCVL